MNTPQRENVVMLTSDEGKRVAIISDRKLYGLVELDDDKIAQLFNGNDTMPLVQGVMSEKEV